MTATNKLALELLQNAAANQTLANITFAQLNQLVQASVTDKDLTAPPATPGDEALFIVGPSATGAWSGKDGQLAYWLSATGVWQFVAPKAGWEVAVIDEFDGNSQPIRYSYNGTVWGVAAGGGSGGGMTNPMTAIRDMIVGGVGGSPTRLPGPASEGMVLTRIGNALAWAIATGFANPMTAAGDLIVGGTAGAASRLGIGTAGQVLTVVAGALAWVTPSGGSGTGDFKSDGSVPMTGAFNEAPILDVVPGQAFADGRVDAGIGANTYRISSSAANFTGFYGAVQGAKRTVWFDVANLILVHNALSFILPTEANITTQQGDWAEFERVVGGAGNNYWACIKYQRKDGTALKATSDPTKVDKVAGLQLSQESYTTLEKAKLAGLDPNHFRGVFATLAALQAAVPAANVGDYAFVDPASGSDVVQYLWDNNDSKWVYNGPTAGVTAAQVKTLYESNPNTNAYTDAEKTRLAALASLVPLPSVAGQFVWNQATNAWVQITKAMVGLDQASNTADNVKPVSAPQQAALDLKSNVASPAFTGGASVAGGDLTLTRAGQAAAAMLTLIADAGQASTLAFQTGSSRRWQVIKSADAESGSNVGSDFSIVRYQDNSSYGSVPLGISRATGRTTIASLAVSGDATVTAPFRVGQFTLTTLPSASAYSGYEIDVTNATGGSKRCRSNGTVWQILNTTTTVS